MMPLRKFYEGCYYHIFNKSISGYQIFKFEKNIYRFLTLLKYYNNILHQDSFSKVKDWQDLDLLKINHNSGVKILTYCIMPTHYHLLVKIIQEDFLSHYIGNAENSYSRFLNIKQKRKGPLWQSRFKFVLVRTDRQLLHLTRYIHLNPTTNNLVGNPEEWKYSSYCQYISSLQIYKTYLPELMIENNETYKRFVLDRRDYQRKLRLLKNVVIE